MYMAELRCMAELRRLTIHCEFVDSFNKTLRERFVCGLKQEHIQKRLLAELKLDLKRLSRQLSLFYFVTKLITFYWLIVFNSVSYSVTFTIEMCKESIH